MGEGYRYQYRGVGRLHQNSITLGIGQKSNNNDIFITLCNERI